MQTPLRVHAGLTAIIDQAFETTAQIDQQAIHAVLDDLARAGLDESAVALLGRVRHCA